MSGKFQIIDNGPDWKEQGRPQRYSAGSVYWNKDGTFYTGMEFATPRWHLLTEFHCESVDDVVDGGLRC